MPDSITPCGGTIGFPIPTAPRPTDDDLERQIGDGVVDSTDGCRVEPDGTCEHGHPSWLINLGIL